MTLGQKLRQARKNAGLTQEELARKLMVSRPAVTKWENDKGLPDVENLKAISRLLNVSLDGLLLEGEDPDLSLMREPVDLSGYGKGMKKKRKDRLLREKFPEEQIYALMPRKERNKGQKIVDEILFWLTDAPHGTSDLVNAINLLGNEFYLVARGEEQYLVQVTDEWMEARRLRHWVDTARGTKFQIGDMIYENCGPIVYA